MKKGLYCIYQNANITRMRDATDISAPACVAMIRNLQFRDILVYFQNNVRICFVREHAGADTYLFPTFSQLHNSVGLFEDSGHIALG